MTQTDDDRTMTVPELLAMAKEIVDADGELMMQKKNGWRLWRKNTARTLW